MSAGRPNPLRNLGSAADRRRRPYPPTHLVRRPPGTTLLRTISHHRGHFHSLLCFLSPPPPHLAVLLATKRSAMARTYVSSIILLDNFILLCLPFPISTQGIWQIKHALDLTFRRLCYIEGLHRRIRREIEK
jgi:hypothetical protein